MKRKLYTLMSALTLTACTAYAVQAWPGLLTRRGADGSTLHLRQVGDEHGHVYVSDDGRTASRCADGSFRLGAAFDAAAFGRSRAARQAKNPARLPGYDFPTIGQLKGLVLLVEFADLQMQPQHSRELFDRMMNLQGYDYNGATGSVADYYRAQSGGRFTPTFDVVGPIELDHNMEWYGSNAGGALDVRAINMITEACDKAKSQFGTDFSQYDFDGDGKVDFVYVIYAGYAESYGAPTQTIWPHASTLASHGVGREYDGKQIDSYACSSELRLDSGTTLEGIGMFCHEFSHILGLPDAYDTRNPFNQQLGYWDVMDKGNYNNGGKTPANMSAYERHTLRWLDFDDLTEPADLLTLPALGDSNRAYRIPTANANEFYTLENRQLSGWDAHLPGAGLMIYHIDYNQDVWQANNVNTGGYSHYDLIESDGTQGDYQASDLYPNWNSSFADYTSPASVLSDGSYLGKAVTRISQEDGVISFRFMNDRVSTPVNFRADAVGDTTVTLVWEPVDNADYYSVTVDQLLSAEQNQLLLAEGFDNLIGGSYPNAEMADLSAVLDDFTKQPGWTGQQVCPAAGQLVIRVRIHADGTHSYDKLVY